MKAGILSGFDFTYTHTFLGSQEPRPLQKKSRLVLHRLEKQNSNKVSSFQVLGSFKDIAVFLFSRGSKPFACKQ